jgi:flagellum-specific peptidoglycan hydrolase FlgJ
MASSKDSGSIGRVPYGPVCPARTPGPLGINDQGDPNVTSLLGNTPGPLGVNDHGQALILQPAVQGTLLQPAGLGVPIKAAITPQQSSAKAQPTSQKSTTALKTAKRFPDDVIAAAQESQRKWGVPASVTLAQWALESNYGKNMPPGSNNPFGIKAMPGQPSVETGTKEEVGGNMISTKALFRKYGSLTEAFDDHGRLLATSRHYTKAMEQSNNPDKFAEALTGVYATDSKYGEKLKRMFIDNNLYQYDISK